MPSKLQKAIGAVKDQTSLSLAKVAKSHSIDVAVLRATSHDDVPVDDRHVTEVLALVSADPTRVRLCARAIARRVGKTRNWIVALKSLVLVQRILQNDVVLFPREVQSENIFNLKNLGEDSNPSPRDFVFAFANYIHDRVGSTLTGRLGHQTQTELLDKIVTWQRLLDRVIETKPAGSVRNNRLIQTSLYGVVRESFDLHQDISDNLNLLLGTFFHIPYDSCVEAFHAFLKSSEQFKELSEFYDLCKNIGVGTTSEYPNVQIMSEELLDTLREFLKNQSNPELSIPAPKDDIDDDDSDLEATGQVLGSNSVIYPSSCDNNDMKLSVRSPTHLKADRLCRGQEQRDQTDQSGDEYNKQSWEIVLFGESKSKSKSESYDPKQCEDILNHATMSQWWTNPFLNELMSSSPSTPQNQLDSNFTTNSISCNDPFGARLECDGPTFRAISGEEANEDVNVTSNDCLPSFFAPLERNTMEIPLENDSFTGTMSPEWPNVAHTPLHNDTFATQGYNAVEMTHESDAFARKRHSISDMSRQNETFVMQPDMYSPVLQVQRQSDMLLPESHNTAQMSMQNVWFPLPTSPECHNSAITRMPPHNNLSAPATPSQLHNDPFALPLVTSQISLHNDPFEHHNDPFVPETPSRIQNTRFQPETPPQIHITTQMSLDNDPFGLATSSQLQNLSFSNPTLLESHSTTQLLLQNDPFEPITPNSLENDPFTSSIAPQRRSVSTQYTNQPTFQASPTFFANEPSNAVTLQDRDDPFAATVSSEGQDMSHEQRLWLEYQNKIIAKHRT